MKLANLADLLNIKHQKDLVDLPLYYHLRHHYFDRFNSLDYQAFQSPSVSLSTHQQRSSVQADSEHSVYQRSDYTPFTLENSFNSIFPPINSVLPKTLFFNSGMAAISSLAYYLYAHKNIHKLILGENAYFETKWLLEGYRHCQLVNEYLFNVPSDADVYWFEYPINCTNPEKYPFKEQLNLNHFFQEILKIVNSTTSQIYLVLDYTLYYLPFDLTPFLKDLPLNLTVFLVTSLQKHRGLGLDLTNAGAITFYSHHLDEDYNYLTRVRAIMGTSITQETAWLMPPLNPKTINQIITDSGLEAKKLFRKINRSRLPIKFYCAENHEFQTCFIFVEIDPSLMKYSTTVPYFSDLLIAEFVKAAKRHHVILIQGTSFGFPFTRIFKNSERYTNTSSLRLAIGWDPDLNKDLDLALKEGVDNFIQKHQV